MAEALIGFFRRLADQLETEVLAAENQALNEAYRIAVLISNGPYDARALARMGHPYAKRNPRPPLPPYIINRQTGRFEESWKINPPRRTSKGFVSSIENTAPYAGMLMQPGPKAPYIRRPFDDYLRRQMGRIRREQKIARAVQRAIQTAAATL
jgi:hypothetical protein